MNDEANQGYPQGPANGGYPNGASLYGVQGDAHNGNNDYPQYGAASQPGEHQPGYAQPGYPQHDSWQGQGGYAGGQRPPAGGQPVYPPVGAGQRQQPYAGGYPQQGAYQRTPYQPYGQPPKKNNTGKIIAIVVSIVVALALIGVLVWALTSKGGRRQGRQGHRNVADDERRFEQQEQRWLHRGSARRLERKLRRRLLRLHQQGLPAEEAGAGQKEAGAAAGTRQLQEEVRRLKLV